MARGVAGQHAQDFNVLFKNSITALPAVSRAVRLPCIVAPLPAQSSCPSACAASCDSASPLRRSRIFRSMMSYSSGQPSLAFQQLAGRSTSRNDPGAQLNREHGGIRHALTDFCGLLLSVSVDTPDCAAQAPSAKTRRNHERNVSRRVSAIKDGARPASSTEDRTAPRHRGGSRCKARASAGRTGAAGLRFSGCRRSKRRSKQCEAIGAVRAGQGFAGDLQLHVPALVRR